MYQLEEGKSSVDEEGRTLELEWLVRGAELGGILKYTYENANLKLKLKTTTQGCKNELNYVKTIKVMPNFLGRYQVQLQNYVPRTKAT